ncbi:UNVERIFIED_CONTAM: hypothetical protein GTU68_016469 [Idotea baltica]|nr:hypothetical protein [Idotea baltica]
MTGLPLIALVTTATDLSFSAIVENSYYRRVIWFSFYQAVISALLSVGLGVPLALALSREQQFPGRQLLINLFSLSLVIPTLVAIFGLVAVFGRKGWINNASESLGFEPFSIYGLSGILLAHTFFNMPLAARVLLQALDNIPTEQWRLSTQLRMQGLAQFRFIEWPAMRTQLLGLFVLIFTLCFTSFTIVMTLGGGPRATTIEVAIYQALRFDFDLNAAVSLALAQLVFCTALLLLSAFFKQDAPLGFGYKAPGHLFRPASEYRWLNAALITLAALFVLLPLVGLIVSAVNPSSMDVITHHNTIKAIVNTIVIALAAAFISVTMGIGLLISSRHLRIRFAKHKLGQWMQHVGNIILVMPPVVLGTGLFLLLRNVADVFSIALLLTIVINSLMALPFVLRIIDGPLMQAATHNDRLIQSLGISGLARWRLLDWPLIRKPVGYALGVSATLAAGDLSAIALFGSERALTLPLLLFQRVGTYRLYEAATTAGILLLVCLCLFMLLQSITSSKLLKGAHAQA